MLPRCQAALRRFMQSHVSHHPFQTYTQRMLSDRQHVESHTNCFTANKLALGLSCNLIDSQFAEMHKKTCSDYSRRVFRYLQFSQSSVLPLLTSLGAHCQFSSFHNFSQKRQEICSSVYPGRRRRWLSMLSVGAH